MGNKKEEAATPIGSTLHCKASAALSEEIKEELKAEDQSLGNILDEQTKESE